MSKNVAVMGTLSVGEGCGGCSNEHSSPLALGGASGCGGCSSGLSYDHAVEFSTAIATAGLVGAAFVDLPPLNQFTAIEFLKLSSTARIRLRLNPTRPTMTGATPLPGIGVQAGAATITVTDSTGTQYVATVNFTAAQNTPALVVAAINAALAAAGAPFPPDGQIARLSGTTLVLVSPGIGPAAFIQLAAGAPVDLGLGAALVRVTGTASDMPDTEGLVVLQFPRSPNAPTKIQVSGVATLEIVAAGRVTA